MEKLPSSVAVANDQIRKPSMSSTSLVLRLSSVSALRTLSTELTLGLFRCSEKQYKNTSLLAKNSFYKNNILFGTLKRISKKEILSSLSSENITTRQKKIIFTH